VTIKHDSTNLGENERVFPSLDGKLFLYYL